MPHVWEDGLQSAIADMWKIDSQVADFLSATRVSPQDITLPAAVMERLRALPLRDTNADPATLRILRLLQSHVVMLVQEVVDTNVAMALANIANARPERFSDLDAALAALQGSVSAPLTMLAWQARALIIAVQPVRTPEAAISTKYALARCAYAYRCHRMLLGDAQADESTATLIARLDIGH